MNVILDLCCGLGGWARGFIDEGFDIVGVDLEDFSADYPGQFIQADLLTWNGWRELDVIAVVASPPCDEFAPHSMPWTRKRNPPEPSMLLIDRCREIARELNTPIVLENVRGAQRWLGRSAVNCGPFSFVGRPVFQGKTKERYGGKDKALRAMIPYELSRHVARCVKMSQAFS